MLVGSSPYVDQLRKLAAQVAPDRVFFHEPVPPAQIVARIHEYDVGFYLLEPSNYNNAMGTPNKLFDFLAAGLAVCIGPSPAMADLVRQYGVGAVATSFEPADVAQTLNDLTAEQIEQMQAAAREASQSFNADTEMAKVIQLCRQLLDRDAKEG
jgi:glycosyltransferase involved in cell wall biosynthesis